MGEGARRALGGTTGGLDFVFFSFTAFGCHSLTYHERADRLAARTLPPVGVNRSPSPRPPRPSRSPAPRSAPHLPPSPREPPPLPVRLYPHGPRRADLGWGCGGRRWPAAPTLAAGASRGGQPHRSDPRALRGRACEATRGGTPTAACGDGAAAIAAATHAGRGPAAPERPPPRAASTAAAATARAPQSRSPPNPIPPPTSHRGRHLWRSRCRTRERPAEMAGEGSGEGARRADSRHVRTTECGERGEKSNLYCSSQVFHFVDLIQR